MTELEKAIARQLRLSSNAAEKLLDIIQENIVAAKEELIRSGCDISKVVEEGPLYKQAIKSYVCMMMCGEDQYERYSEMFKYQQDSLRKS